MAHISLRDAKTQHVAVSKQFREAGIIFDDDLARSNRKKERILRMVFRS